MRKYIKKMSRLVTRILTVLFFVCILTSFYMPVSNVPVVYATAGVDEIDGSGSLDTEGGDDFNLSISTNEGSASLSGALKILLVLTIISLAPSILIMVTSFTRILITLHFTRSALGTQTTPPNQILIGLALFLSIFIMAPVFTQINNEAIEPYSSGTITQEEAIEKGIEPLRTFMLKQTRRKDLKTFIGIAGIADEEIESVENIPITVIIPSFIISELRKAFIIGFLIYLPFIIIDMVVASTLMSMGMMMLPPTTISMPFKILLFILADGWNLIIGEVVRSFY